MYEYQPQIRWSIVMYIPTLNDLSQKQWEIQDLPLKGRYLIKGGPGSGKTIIALRRTEAIKKESPGTTIGAFLFTNALNDFFSDAMDSLMIRTGVRVWAKWQMAFLRNHGQTWARGEKVPWQKLSDMILRYEVSPEFDHLIIDEAQDFGDSDIRVMNLLAENITVFADRNQTIHMAETGNDRVERLKSLLSIDNEDEHELTENYRNTRQIMEAAIPLATEEVVFDYIPRSGSKPKLWSYDSFETQVDTICKILSANKQRDVAVLHFRNDRTKSLYDAVESKVNGSITLELVKQNRFDFDTRSVKFCTLDSAKGLEFDVVIMPWMSQDDYWVAPSNQTRIYVGMTRPRHELILMYPRSNPSEYLFQIPPEHLDRKDLM